MPSASHQDEAARQQDNNQKLDMYMKEFLIEEIENWKTEHSLTTAENVTIFGFISGASNRIKAPLLPICKII